MSDPYVRLIGRAEDLDEAQLGIGVDYDAVTLDTYRFSGGGLDSLMHLLVAAIWAAGYNKARMEEEAGEAVSETIEVLRARLAGHDA